ncbi:zinc finger protein [Elysia marginata]|uniref:Zinc finger protein n=1 Tax=Elysia marginata TaxID=1093978 RepID=A0AAV4JZ24_9GAST|nr:zinc finger protein [Elysia marginata]
MPFGMMNSGATLTRAVKKLLCGMDNVVDYIDDLLVHTETWKAHVETLVELFGRLREANFTVRPVKCVLGSSTIDFLGHRLGRGTISLQDENVEKNRCSRRLALVKNLKSKIFLLSLSANYMSKFHPVNHVTQHTTQRKSWVKAQLVPVTCDHDKTQRRKT